jgi:hypothetical protein
MAVCKACHKDMLKTDSCVKVPVLMPQGGSGPKKALEPLPYDGEGRCHDCNAAPGGYHHPGCDMERCPACGGQLISCGCLG